MARLRHLTIGSILGSVVALGTFATAAALSYSGKATAGAPSASSNAPATSAPSTSSPTTTPQTPRSTPTPAPTQVPFGRQPSATTGGS